MLDLNVSIEIREDDKRRRYRQEPGDQVFKHTNQQSISTAKYIQQQQVLLSLRNVKRFSYSKFLTVFCFLLENIFKRILAIEQLLDILLKTYTILVCFMFCCFHRGSLKCSSKEFDFFLKKPVRFTHISTPLQHAP